MKFIINPPKMTRKMDKNINGQKKTEGAKTKHQL